jgi:hypothetical protein
MASILAANALTTLAALNAALKLTSDAGGAQDQAVERVINEASSFVEKYCGVTFRRQDGIVESLKGFGRNILRVARRPIISITSIAIDGGALDASTYVIEDADAGKIYAVAGWPWTAQRAPGISQSPVPRTEDPSRIVVTYSAGYVTQKQIDDSTVFTPPTSTRTLPWDLEGAVLRLATSWWLARGRDGAEAARSFEASGVTWRPDGIPPDVTAVLRQYKRFAHA